MTNCVVVTMHPFAWTRGQRYSYGILLDKWCYCEKLVDCCLQVLLEIKSQTEIKFERFRMLEY